MNSPKKAPSLQEIKNREEQKKQNIEQAIQNHAASLRRAQDQEDLVHAQEIIDAVDKMFDEGRVSSHAGGSLTKIPENYITPGVKTLVDRYLGQDWSSSWKDNNDSHDFDGPHMMLIIKPTR